MFPLSVPFIFLSELYPNRFDICYHSEINSNLVASSYKYWCTEADATTAEAYGNNSQNGYFAFRDDFNTTDCTGQYSERRVVWYFLQKKQMNLILSIMVFSSTWCFRKWSNISQYESSGFPRFFLLDVHSSNIPQKKSWKPRSLKSRHIWPFTKRPCRRKHHDSKYSLNFIKCKN